MDPRDKPEDDTRGAGGVSARDGDCDGAARGRTASIRRPGGAILLAAEAGGDETLDIGEGAQFLVGCDGRRFAPDDGDPIALGELDDGVDEALLIDPKSPQQRA